MPLENFTREIDITQDFLHFPVQMDAPKRMVKLQRDGESLREFEIQFATGEPDFWVYLETHEFQGESLALVIEQRRYEPSNILESVSAGPEPKNFDTFYTEKLRPQFHYSSPRGWNNDPNGMVYYDGEYHLFLPAQSLRLGLGEYDVGPRRQHGHAALGESARRASPRRVRHHVLWHRSD